MYWQEWSKYINKYGISTIYSFKAFDNETNYTPLYLYFLNIFSWINGSQEAIVENIKYVKLIAVVFDFATVILLLNVFKNSIKPLVFLLLILNPAFLYNSVVWGQVDSIYTFFAIYAFILLFQKRFILSLVMLTLSLLFKMQAMLFLPIYGILLLFEVKINWKKILIGILISILLGFISFSPFIVEGEFSQAIKALSRNTSLYPYISVNAYNFWYLLYGNEANSILDKEIFWHITYKLSGLVLYGTSFLFILYRLWKINLLDKFQKPNSSTENSVFINSDHVLAILLFYLCFFYFSTQMHERYSHPVILISFIYFLLSKRIYMYVLLSIAYFINLERVAKLWHFDEIYSVDFYRVSYYIFLFCILLGFYRLYQKKDYKLSI